ncbi:MAG: DsbA family oxidoreductase [Synergistaceae bacterium]|nr:DsbA family oxidoreductase [Synergistaceae bacterium]MBR0093981.1 DsbA family oxidoreductase [Synergistaceae bacterium]
MKIIYWSDYACPYCYIGEARLKKALQGLDIPVELEMKSFQLDITAPKKSNGDTQTRFANKYGISFAQAGVQIEVISRMGRSEGLDFKYATTLFTNTMDAHRLTKLAQSKNDPALTERVIENLFKAYFSDNRELADLEILQEIGEKSGLNSLEVKNLLASKQFEEDVKKDELEAFERGIHGVPFYIINDKHTISGTMNAEGMREIIRQAYNENVL